MQKSTMIPSRKQSVNWENGKFSCARLFFSWSFQSHGIRWASSSSHQSLNSTVPMLLLISAIQIVPSMFSITALSLRQSSWSGIWCAIDKDSRASRRQSSWWEFSLEIWWSVDWLTNMDEDCRSALLWRLSWFSALHRVMLRIIGCFLLRDLWRPLQPVARWWHRE